MRRSTTLDLFFLTSLAAGLVAFAVDAYFGENGRLKMPALEADISLLQGEVAALETEKAALAAKAAALRGPEIDAELLEERLRAVHGVAHPRDVLIVDAD
ncbi:MAG: septum formation initiator family protein [Rhodobacteraceae bacterium]|nr:septum formation initiator family protein [Paracoccaceae bacterium]